MKINNNVLLDATLKRVQGDIAVKMFSAKYFSNGFTSGKSVNPLKRLK
jgi:hypothetical protein